MHFERWPGALPHIPARKTRSSARRSRAGNEFASGRGMGTRVGHFRIWQGASAWVDGHGARHSAAKPSASKGGRTSNQAAWSQIADEPKNPEFDPVRTHRRTPELAPSPQPYVAALK